MPLSRTFRRAAARLAATGVLAATVLLVGPAPPSPLSAAGRAVSPVAGKTVTLVTGDRVVLGPSGRTVHIEPGPNRAGVTFTTREFDGRLEVLPSDASALLGAGRLDRRLFDVTGLVEMGYNDQRDLSLIVTHGGGKAATTTARSRAASAGTVTRELPVIDGLAVRVPKESATRLWRDLSAGPTAKSLAGGVEKIWLDARRRTTLDTSVGQIGAPTAWAGGHTGAGVTVAVVDTGVDDTHPDLAGKVRDRVNLVEGEDDKDNFGHGTHVASTIAGSGVASEGRYRGVAPDAALLDVKVCDAGGWCPESYTLAGMQWAAERGADVVNMSLGWPDAPGMDLLEESVQDLTARHGTLFVVAAGNEFRDRTVSSPASAPAALAVGAVDDQNAVANFSSRGPRLGDSGLKPEITAPGVDITAARANEGGYVTMQGTSMATPHVTGAAAILAGVHADWGPDRLKAALMSTATPGRAGVFAQGAGRVDVAAASTARVTVDEGGVGFGRQLWPHADDPVLTRTVTYRNHGDAPVSLDLAVNAVDGSGAPLDAALFAVSTARLTVPAGGTAQATVTADTRTAVPDGFLGGYLRATADGVTVSTPLAVEKEVESYDIAFTVTDFDGAATANHATGVYRVDGDAATYYSHSVFDAGVGQDSFTLRLPKGRWVVRSSILGADESTSAVLIHPRLDLGADQQLSLDARLGRPVTVSLPDKDARQMHGSADIHGTIATGEAYQFGWIGEDFGRLRSAQLGPDQAYDGVTSKVDGTWAAAGAAYDLGFRVPGRYPTGFTRTVARASLVAITNEYAQQVPGSTGWQYSASFLPGVVTMEYVRQLPFALPSTQVKYVNTDGGLRWEHTFWEAHEAGRTLLWSPDLISYRAGGRYTESWNGAVHGPILEGGLEPNEVSGVNRFDDELWIFPRLYADSSGHIGTSSVDDVTVTLHRNGEPVAPDFDGGLLQIFVVPPEEAAYRLVVDAKRNAPVTLSTRTRMEWTFRSGHVDGDVGARLSTSVVRFTPRLTAGQSAPAGVTFEIPLTVQRQPDSTAKPVRTLSVDVSYDDGATWTPATVRRHGERGAATVRHPAGAGYVSLRATATDKAGNTVTQTVVRAYRLAP
ncbi:S8 family peptidase [Micromonospora deserti]|uniref:Peptidase S8 n=1 Tax=Micromonospora deserti TaxID=2070366 RepID=A0A2W2BZX8_9ACTN|nr:S8 family serine peptidase [Micromonospora deserti]PZF91692.1 peptidase S8 [Micromonospora deserti]